MIYIGIDQSFTGTGVTIYYNNQYQFYLISTKKNNINKSIDYTLRMINIINNIDYLIKQFNKKNILIGIEGVSFGSKGVLADLGGLSHLLQYYFITNQIKFYIIPPTVVKKFFTNKGNASKMEMIKEAEKYNINIPKKKNKDYFDDNIVDSFAICQLIQNINKLDKDIINKIEYWEPKNG